MERSWLMVSRIEFRRWLGTCQCSVLASACKEWWRLCTWNCSSESKYLLFLNMQYCQPPDCIEVNSFNITLCCLTILIFLIHFIIMMSFSFSLIPSKKGGDVMLSCSNFTLIFYMLLCSSDGCMLASWCETSSLLVGNCMIFVVMK